MRKIFQLFRLSKIARVKPNLFKTFQIKRKLTSKIGRVFWRTLDVVTIGAIGYDLFKGGSENAAVTSEEKIEAYIEDSASLMRTVFLPDSIVMAISLDVPYRSGHSHIFAIAALRAMSKSQDDLSIMMGAVYTMAADYIKVAPTVSTLTLDPEVALANIKSHYQIASQLSGLDGDDKAVYEKEALAMYQEMVTIANGPDADPYMMKIIDWLGYCLGNIQNYYDQPDSK